MFSGQIFVKNAKNDPKTLHERQNRTKFENRKKAEILVNSAKTGLFVIQNGKIQPFFKMLT